MTLKIKVYSDVVCPWCFLGKRRLEKSLEKVDADRFEVGYLPYELNPAQPNEGIDRKKYLYSKYGPVIETVDKRIEMMGKEVGIDYRFDRASRIPNTFNAHRVIWFAAKEGCQKAAVDSLFKAYFTDGRDLGDVRALAEVAALAGLDATQIEKFLKSNEGIEEVRILEEKAYDLGISGVPHFVFGDELEISGAQSVETFVSVLAQLDFRPRS